MLYLLQKRVVLYYHPPFLPLWKGLTVFLTGECKFSGSWMLEGIFNWEVTRFFLFQGLWATPGDHWKERHSGHFHRCCLPGWGICFLSQWGKCGCQGWTEMRWSAFRGTCDCRVATSLQELSKRLMETLCPQWLLSSERCDVINLRQDKILSHWQDLNLCLPKHPCSCYEPTIIMGLPSLSLL